MSFLIEAFLGFMLGISLGIFRIEIYGFLLIIIVLCNYGGIRFLGDSLIVSGFCKVRGA